MSTRSNIAIISKEETKVIYHHCDGYPEGVGAELLDEHLKVLDDETPSKFANALMARDASYQYTNGRLHGDIEYLYVVDTDKKTLTCYSLDIWNTKCEDSEIINGNCEKIRVVFSVNYKTEMLDNVVLA